LAQVITCDDLRSRLVRTLVVNGKALALNGLKKKKILKSQTKTCFAPNRKVVDVAVCVLYLPLAMRMHFSLANFLEYAQCQLSWSLQIKRKN
jgi:hypothetical protein